MQTIEKILNKIIPITNHQGQEQNLSSAILNLINEISFPEICEVEFNSKWGLYFKIKSTETPNKNGILFLGHLDSNEHFPSFSIENGFTFSKDKIGLDNKAGISSILYTLYFLSKQKLVFPFEIHIYFSVMEEVGQKGAMNFPLEKIKGKIRYGISVDRKTQANGGGGVRHFINSYHGIPMVIPEDISFLEKSLKCKGISSPNCADIIELRGRYDAEVIYPMLIGEKDSTLEKYEYWTNKIKDKFEDTIDPLPIDEAISGMNQSPRKDRYDEMAKIYKVLYNSDKKIPEELKLSFINLSIDFEDPKISLKEIKDTSNILINFIKKYSLK